MYIRPWHLDAHIFYADLCLNTRSSHGKMVRSLPCLLEVTSANPKNNLSTCGGKGAFIYHPQTGVKEKGVGGPLSITAIQNPWKPRSPTFICVLSMKMQGDSYFCISYDFT